MSEMNGNNPGEIAIFVSHRIDLNSKVIDNPMYHPMRCGATYDERPEPNFLPGDNTGDNVSDLRIPFCEFTVQYWAWKNYDAEYYGLCHYRRFLSFSDKIYPSNDYNLRIEKTLDRVSAEKYQLLNYSKMEKDIRDNDVVVGSTFETTKITRIHPKSSVMELWLASTNNVNNDAVYLVIDIIREKFPQYAECMDEYLASRFYRGYNCFVMKKEIFNQFSEFLFGVLFEFNERYDFTGLTGNKLRAPGYMGELVFGVFMWYLTTRTEYKVCEKQIVFFENTECESNADRTITYKTETDPDIAIAVSQRNDHTNALVNAPAYVNIRKNAINDKYNHHINCVGDNTGYNISELSEYIGDLSVQYWLWKNIKSSFYGVCGYNKYFSLSGKKFRENADGKVAGDALTAKSVSRFKLENKKALLKLTRKNEAVFPHAVPLDASGYTFGGSVPRTVRDLFVKSTQICDENAADMLISIIDELCPEYSAAAERYIGSTEYYPLGYFIMSAELFDKFCEFEFGVIRRFCEEYDLTTLLGSNRNLPFYLSDILFGTFITWLKESGSHTLGTAQIVKFKDTKDSTKKKRKSAAEKDSGLKKFMKKVAYHLSPSYRVALRNEERLLDLVDDIRSASAGSGKPSRAVPTSLQKNAWDEKTLTSGIALNYACLALEIHETHKASFSEFRDCHTGKAVAVVATGPSMSYYTQIPDISHIGMNAAFKNENLSLDYYFTTDYESRNSWFNDLKDYDCIKFFGQYSTGSYRDRFQVSEQIIRDNNGRRFFQGAPSEDININIEYYPLMGFYSIAFQAIHFALYTNAKAILLVGCDCSNQGYYDGSAQAMSNPPKWVQGYEKLKYFVERFYPQTEIVSVNPIGLRGLFHDVYTEEFLDDHPEINRDEVEILDPEKYSSMK